MFTFEDSEHVPINTDGVNISFKIALFDYLSTAQNNLTINN